MRRTQFLDYTGLKHEDFKNLKTAGYLPKMDPTENRKWMEYTSETAEQFKRAVSLAKTANLRIPAAIRVVLHVDNGGVI
jgi:hypothetical protein